MIRILLILISFVGTPLAAQESCICFKCLLGGFKSFQTNGSAMAPGLEHGGCFTARYINGDYDRISAGVRIVFEHPKNNSVFVFRGIGLPGDSVQMIDGIVWLNGVLVAQVGIEDYEKKVDEAALSGSLPLCQRYAEVDGICRIERALETLPNGVSYEVLNLRDSNADNTDIFTVQEGNVFVLGDNRDNSIDSRFSREGPFSGIGLVPFENIFGIVEEN